MTGPSASRLAIMCQVKIGRRLRVARRRAGLSQRALAARAGVPASTVARIETGVLDPRIGTVERLLRACGHALEVEADHGEGVDLSLLDTTLAMSPQERIDSGLAAARSLGEMRGAAQRDR